MLAKSFRELDVFKNSFAAAREIFNITKKFPVEEKYSMTDQIRRSSRSVCTNIGEAWRKRKLYEKHFVTKLSDSDAEATETQIWLMFAVDCGYINEKTFDKLFDDYEKIGSQLSKMIDDSSDWCTNASTRNTKRKNAKN